MAHFIRVRTSGFWTTNSTLLSTEMEAFDAQLYKAVNGDDGGVWAPSSVIEIGGSGLKVTGALVITGAASFTGGVTANTVAITGDLTVQTNATIQGYLTAESDTEVQGALAVTGATTIGGTCAVTGNVTLSGTCTVTNDLSTASDLSVQGNAAIQGNLDADGATVETLGIHSAVAPGEVFTADGSGSLTGDLDVGGALAVTGTTTLATASLGGITTPTGIGRVRYKIVAGADANTTYTIEGAELVLIVGGSLTAGRTYTLGTTGAVNGDRIKFVSRHGAHAVNISVPSNLSDNRTLQPGTTGQYDWVEYIFYSSAWYVAGGYKEP